jgi:hypothetical protein
MRDREMIVGALYVLVLGGFFIRRKMSRRDR